MRKQNKIVFSQEIFTRNIFRVTGCGDDFRLKYFSCFGVRSSDGVNVSFHFLHLATMVWFQPGWKISPMTRSSFISSGCGLELCRVFFGLRDNGLSNRFRSSSMKSV